VNYTLKQVIRGHLPETEDGASFGATNENETKKKSYSLRWYRSN